MPITRPSTSSGTDACAAEVTSTSAAPDATPTTNVPATESGSEPVASKA